MSQINSWYGPGGALVTDKPVDGCKQHKLNGDSEQYYGKPYLFAESMTEESARLVSDALSFAYQGRINCAATFGK